MHYQEYFDQGKLVRQLLASHNYSPAAPHQGMPGTPGIFDLLVTVMG